MVERCASVCRRTWEYVGSDVLACEAEVSGKSWVSREVVIEAVLDADRYQDDGDKEAVAEICKRLKAGGWGKKPINEITDIAFPKSMKRWG
jgi:hypothetical protein